MSQPAAATAGLDLPPPDPAALWAVLRAAAASAAAEEPLLAPMLSALVERRSGFGDGLAEVLGQRLADPLMPPGPLGALIAAAFAAAPAIESEVAHDLVAIFARDPAAAGDPLTPYLHYKGFHAVTAHRVAHRLWQDGRRAVARALQARVAQALGVDIHPAARFGHGVFIDHATGVVIGETAVVGNDVSILQGVTLGGTGKEAGDRHPKVRDGVLLGAGAKVLGNVVIGRGAKVGAGSVVLRDVPPCATVAGVPARIVGWCKDAIPALAMDHRLPEESAPGG
jgi:serine O-acetyltransferase